MNDYYIRSDVLILTAALPVMIGTYRYRSMDTGSKIFYYLSVLGFMVESLAYYMAVRYRNNLVVYNLSSIAEIFLIAVYYNYTIVTFRRRNLGIIIGLLCVGAGIANNFYIQSIHGITHFFLFFESLAIIIMSAIALASFMKPDDDRTIKNAVHFWLPVVLIFSWTLSYLLFSLINLYAGQFKEAAPSVVITLFLIEVTSNLAVAAIFLLLPKMHTHVQ